MKVVSRVLLAFGSDMIARECKTEIFAGTESVFRGWVFVHFLVQMGHRV